MVVLVAMVAMLARAGAKAAAEVILEEVALVVVAMAAEVMVVEGAATARVPPAATAMTVVA